MNYRDLYDIFIHAEARRDDTWLPKTVRERAIGTVSFCEDRMSREGITRDQLKELARAGSVDKSVTMSEVVHAVGAVTTLMGDMAAASRHQSAGIIEVNKAVQRIDETTQSNAAPVEEAAAAAQSLDDQAQHLNAAVSVFTTPAA